MADLFVPPNRVVFLLTSKSDSTLDWRTEVKYRDLGLALERAGFAVETAPWRGDNGDELEQDLAGCVLLVWVNPVDRNLESGDFEALLVRLQDRGTFVGGDPRVIRRIGTKSVLVSMAGTPWVPEALLLTSEEELLTLKRRLDQGLTRVTKQHRGNDGLSVYKLEKTNSGEYQATEAHSQKRLQDRDFGVMCRAIAPAITTANPTIEVPWNDGLVNGVVRCYFCVDQIAGFGYQEINALYPYQLPPEIPKQRFYVTENCALFEGLKKRIEHEFLDELCARTGVARDDLPLLWDADFFMVDHSHHRYELCEINASCVSPFPPSAIAHVVRAISAIRPPSGDPHGKLRLL